MIRDNRRREEPGELQPAVAVRRAHHGNLNALIAQPSNTSGPFSFDRGPPFEIEAELAKEFDRRCEVIDDDSYVVHSFKRHISVYKVAFIPTTNRAANCSEAVSMRGDIGNPCSLPQDLVHGLSFGQFIHQLVQVTDLLHELILDLLHPIAADHAGNLGDVGVDAWCSGEESLEVDLLVYLLLQRLFIVAR